MMFSKSQHKKNIEKKRYSIEKIQRLHLDGKVNAKELLTEGLITQEQYDQVIDIPNDIHLERIKNKKYGAKEIKALVNDGTLDISDLEGVLTSEEIDVLFPPPPPMPTGGKIEIDWVKLKHELDEAPPLGNDRVAIFVLGIAGSGKSTFMGGLLHHVYDIGRLQKNLDNPTGSRYLDIIQNAIQDKRLPASTSEKYVDYMSFDFIDEDGKSHPLSFVEMAGEVFQKYYHSKPSDVHPKFNNYLNGDSRKMLFFTLDYNAIVNPTESESDGEERRSQATQFEYVINHLNHHGRLNTVDAIALIVTKWDLSPSQKEEDVREFLKSHGLSNLIETCKRYRVQFNFRFEVFSFSLGQFSNGVDYEFDPVPSKRIYQWICSFSPVRNTSSKKLFGGFFKS